MHKRGEETREVRSPGKKKGGNRGQKVYLNEKGDLSVRSKATRAKGEKTRQVRPPR